MPVLQLDIDAYLLRVRRHASESGLEHITQALKQQDKDITKAFITSSEGAKDVHGYAAMIDLAEQHRAIDNPTVCIVENISPNFIGALGHKWGLDEEFFVQHATNPSKHWINLWPPRIFADSQYASSRQREPSGQPDAFEDSVQSQPPRQSPRQSPRPRPYDYIDGNFEYHGVPLGEAKYSSAPNYFDRHCFESPWYGKTTWYSNTRISYYCVDDRYLYLFLVDAPIKGLMDQYKHPDQLARPTLRLPYASNLGGLLLPQLLEKKNEVDTQYSIFETLKKVFPYRWHRELLFDHERAGLGSSGPEAFPAPPLCYLLSNSLWLTNLRYLTKEVRRISFEQVRYPTLEINDTLHDLWKDVVAFLKTGLAETKDNIPEPINKFWECLKEKKIKVIQDASSYTPATKHEVMLREAEELERFLMDTFQLLMSSIIVIDNQTSHEQAVRATQLTILASIYIPLSFATGFLGMNVKEFNGSVLSIWVFFVVAVGTLIATVLGYFYLKGKPSKSKDNKHRTQREKIDVMKENSPRRQKTVSSYV